ncbi:MAG: hypothetical protein K2P84_14230 [Undibacterium sp.]|nr:hypothetical protein [Undibacterium sp.]
MSHHSQSRDHLEFGICIILIGCTLLLDKTGLLFFSWHLWIAFVALLGLVRLVRGPNARKRISGLFDIVLAGALYAMLEHMWGLNFFTHWPILVIIWGLAVICKYAVQTSNDQPK